jgi:hypothetical protein
VDRENRRYFSIVHLYNAGLSDDELLTARHGLVKLLNSLSWGETIALPVAVGDEKMIFRIDLRQYGWPSRAWEKIVAANPYDTRLPGARAVQIARLTGTGKPVVRADWFVAAASRPPLYHDILALPRSARELERALLGVEARNAARNKVARAGFNGSEVSTNNRLIERHEIPIGTTWKARNARWPRGGAYWKSYDFAANSGRKNLFDFPLGPGTGAKQFEHDGGEIIFNLPNGLQAYMLVKADDTRIDEGPINIVSDRRKNALSVTVINGISCMSCHSAGMIPKDDQVRGNVARAGLRGYNRDEVLAVFALYPKKEELQKKLRADAERFGTALKRTGAQTSKTEPVSSLVGQFEREVDAKLAAAEVGLSLEPFRAGLEKSTGEVRRLFGSLLAGGTVKREVMNRHFRDLVRAVADPGNTKGRQRVPIRPADQPPVNKGRKKVADPRK